MLGTGVLYMHVDRRVQFEGWRQTFYWELPPALDFLQVVSGL